MAKLAKNPENDCVKILKDLNLLHFPEPRPDGSVVSVSDS